MDYTLLCQTLLLITVLTLLALATWKSHSAPSGTNLSHVGVGEIRGRRGDGGGGGGGGGGGYRMVCTPSGAPGGPIDLKQEHADPQRDHEAT